MKRILNLTILALFLFPIKAWCVSPDEQKVYFHLHQATRWTEIHYSKEKFYALAEARKHLGAIKYSEPKLVKSVFYDDFKFLNKLTVAPEATSMSEVERFRNDIHAKAERHQIPHPLNWEDEFFLE